MTINNNENIEQLLWLWPILGLSKIVIYCKPFYHKEELIDR